MTEPHSWELLRASRVGDKKPVAPAKLFRLELIDGCEEQYAFSEFGEIEMKLKKLVDMIRQQNDDGKPDVGNIRNK